MDTRKVLGIIFSILFVGAFTFVLCWGIINFNKVKDSMSSTGVYTEQDVNNAYQDGYNTALEDKDSYTELINSYRDTITSQTDQISQLNSQITHLTNTNRDYANQINNLTNIKLQNEDTISTLQNTIVENNLTIETLTIEKTNLQVEVNNLTNQVTTNELTISSLNSQIQTLQTQLENLTQSDIDKTDDIANLNSQINELQSRVNTLTNNNANLNSQIKSLETQIDNLETLNIQLENTNNSNQQTINVLNAQIVSLNTQISEISFQLQNNSSNVSALNTKIAELEKSIAYYEEYVASLENDNQVIVTFEHDGSVYNIQVLNKNSIASVTNPASNDYKIFNYWTLNGNQVELADTVITQNTTFVSNVTYRYDVNFISDGLSVNSQIVTKGEFATLPQNPSKAGYEFDGWSLNGVDVIDVTTNPITVNTTYSAVFTKLFGVTFIYEDEIVSTQTIRNGNFASAPTIQNTDYKIFNGWKLNNSFVNVENYKVTSNLSFVADITYRYDVDFMVDETLHNTQIVTTNGYATMPTSPIKSGYEFDGWTIDGINVINPTTIVITKETSFIAKFTKLHTVNFVVEGTTVKSVSIRNNNLVENYIPHLSTGIFNGWKINNDIVNLSTYKILADTTLVADITYPHTVTFMVDDKVYDTQSVLNGELVTVEENFEKVKFNGWKVNDTIVDLASYPITTDTTFVGDFDYYYWEYFSDVPVTKNLYDDYNLGIWTDGDYLYFSYAEDSWGKNAQTYIYDFENSSWNAIQMTFGDDFTIKPKEIWSNGKDIFYSAGQTSQYKYDKTTRTWTEIKWKGYDGGNFTTDFIWTDGTNYYYSWRDDQYLVDFDTYTLIPITWNGLSGLYGYYTWNYNGNTYYSTGSDGGRQYILDVETRTWTLLSEYNYYQISGEYVVNVGDSVYCSRYGSLYEFDPDAEQYAWNSIGAQWQGELENHNHYFNKNMILSVNGMYFVYYRGNIVKLVTSVM